MRRCIYIVMCIIVLCITACDVHEFPEEKAALVPFTLHLDFNSEMPLYKELTYTRSSTENAEATAAEPHDVRYTINAYRTDNVATESRTADTTFVITKSNTYTLNHTARIELPEGSYRFRVWADYIDAGSTKDKYYDTSDFAQIMLCDPNNHPGSTDYRDAFRGETTGVVINKDYYINSTANAIANEATVDMRRPMGKFQIISTDVEIFLTRVEEAMKEAGIVTRGQTAYDRLLQSVRWSDYKIVVRYESFMPCAYNMFTDKPAEAWTGISFDSRMYPLSSQEIELGFDYIFVNGSETTLSISLAVYDANGVLVSSTHPFDVPIVRSKLTVIKGEFLTSIADGGVSINPGYDGDDYNIEIKW